MIARHGTYRVRLRPRADTVSISQSRTVPGTE
jgi:hypothetical protein